MEGEQQGSSKQQKMKISSRKQLKTDIFSQKPDNNRDFNAKNGSTLNFQNRI